ncbi:MAG: CatB-related O-acetyltransferase [Paludibacter sp.]
MYPIYRKLNSFGKIIKHVFSRNTNWFAILNFIENTELGQNVVLSNTYHITNSIIGNYTYIARNSNIYNTNIGRFCSIGSNFISGQGIHPINGISTAPMFYSNLKQNGVTLSKKNKVVEFLPVIIGNDIFIGDNVTVLSGITIGDGAVIGAGAVVSKDIPPYAVAVGCPIQIKKYRFTDNQIEALLRIKWWDFEEEKLKKVERNFFDIDLFIGNHDL